MLALTAISGAPYTFDRLHPRQRHHSNLVAAARADISASVPEADPGSAAARARSAMPSACGPGASSRRLLTWLDIALDHRTMRVDLTGEIVGRLQVQPEFRAGAEIARQSQCGVGRDAARLLG